MKKGVVHVFLVVTLIVMVGCAQQPEMLDQEGGWRGMVLSDVASGEEFSVADFENKPILLESFAVWCPLCTKQQQEIQKLHELLGEQFVSVALNTDPNEDEAKVLEHVKRHGFTGHYSVAPVAFTQRLIDEFGVGVVHAPQVPVILVCSATAARLLEPGVKKVAQLQKELELGC